MRLLDVALLAACPAGSVGGAGSAPSADPADVSRPVGGTVVDTVSGAS